ncbi:MAG: SAM-dependent methyltransferase [Promethearchaeota archaeon]
MTKNPERHKKDPHYKQAKHKGYRARSAFKLLDIQKRFKIFKRAYYILDIGSTPGSWLQVAYKFVSPLEGIYTVKMDITNPEFQKELDDFFIGKKLDLILSDLSINKTGNKFVDQLRQINLCFKVLDIVKLYLKYRGVLVLKIFQGQDFENFFKAMKNEFFKTLSYKPKASRKQSNEIYLIGLRKNN